MNEGKFLYGRLGPLCIIKPVGTINYRISNSFSSFIDKILTDTTISGFIIDLTATDYIDSTNLGLLARIREFSVTNFFSQPVMISTKAPINEILAGLGFDRMFSLVDSAPQAPSAELGVVPQTEATSEGLGAVMLTAHRYLMATNDHNAEMFRDIVSLLESDLRARQKAD
jgi:anti-anti-sigma factor